MSKPKEQLFCYLRVSSQVQLDEGNSIDNQRFLGQRVSKQLGLEYVELNEESSSTMISSEEDLIKSPRPKFEEMKEGIRIGRVKNIWYYSRSRYCRDSVEDGFIRRHYFQKYNLKVYEGVNGELRKYGTSQERYMDSQFSLIQEYFKDQNREVSVSGKRHKSRSEGKNSPFMGGTVNFGYDNVDSRFVVHKEESKWIKKLYNLYLKDVPLKEIKTLFDVEGIPQNVKPRRSKTWSLGTLLSMLKNRIYIGEYSWKDKETGEVFPIVVPKIITHSVFNRVQRKIEENIKNRGTHFKQYDTLLDGLLVCYCGERIFGNVRKTVNKNIYICNSKNNEWKGKKVEECQNRRSLNMEMTDSFVVENIRDIVGDSSKLKQDFKEDVLKHKQEESVSIEVQKKELERKIKLIDKDIEHTLKSISTNEFNLLQKSDSNQTVVYKQVKSLLDEELGSLEDKKNSYIQQIDDLDSRKEWVDWVGKYGDDIYKRFEKPTSELLKGFITSIEVKPTNGKNRDGVEKQIGHKLKIRFSQPIVGDSIEYNDNKNKKKGYKVVNGKKVKDIGSMTINVGGRGKKKGC
jgi:hypothetical protein